jgi:hypothetical protein
MIMYEGKFYDAGSFKAAPVPMALETGTVYEGVRDGKPLGLFTVTETSGGPGAWIAEGTWEPAGSAPPKKAPEPPKPANEESDKPPRLTRSGPEKPKPAAVSAPQDQSEKKTSSAPPASSSPTEDPDRPRLRREKPRPQDQNESPAMSAEPLEKAAGPMQILPAISDAEGTEPRPYTYAAKAQEEQQFRKKMTALATAQIMERAHARAAQTASPSPSKSARSSRAPTPVLVDVQLRIFDLSNANEPTLVLTAKAQMPPGSAGGPAVEYYVTVVARSDLYGDLQKAFSNVTDSRHVDVLPRFDLIDAVDADGDGHGELLFAKVSDAGRAFVVYRVIGNQLWSLFEGPPQ